MLCESKGNLESSFELTYNTKRQLTLIGLALRRFADGLDYMIILPSLWFYLASFQSWYFFLGLVIAADSLVAFFLSPWIEKLGESWRKVRFLGFVANLFHIAGGMIYALSLNYYMPLAGRLVSGVGLSFGGALYAEVKRVTTFEERNRVFIIMEGVRLIGIVIAPGINFFIRNFDLRFGPWVINSYTAPGFFMAIVWLVVQLVHIFTVFDLDEAPQAAATYQKLNTVDDADDTPFGTEPMPSASDLFPRTSDHSSNDSDHLPAIPEHVPLPDEDRSEHFSADSEDEPRPDDDRLSIGEDEPTGTNVDLPSDGNMNIEMTKFPVGESVEPRPLLAPSNPFHELHAGNDDENPPGLLSLLGRSDILLILGAQFLMFFNQTAFETLILLIGVEKLDFGVNILSGVFIVAGIEMVVVIVMVWSANKTLDAKYLLLSALSSGILASFARLAVTFTKAHSSGCLVMTLLMGCFTIIGTPITSIAGKSLLPKITRPEHHNVYQSAFATAQHLGLIAGPLVASAMYNYMVLFSSLVVVIFLFVYLMAMKIVEKLTVSAHGCGK